MDESKLRAWWSTRQGLDGSLKGKSPEAVLKQSGWARSVGGVGPYLTLQARAGTSRAEADQAVKDLTIHELPSARGCTYVLPAEDFALGLKLGQNDTDLKVAAKLGVTEKEIEKLCGAVLDALEGEALDPDGIREKVGDAARSLGEAGKKKGMSTTLPTALGRLQSAGEIRRVPVDGRLDQQRYKYTKWKVNPLEKFKLTLEEAQVELGRRFFRWIGPATAAEFQWFSALGVKAAKSVIDKLGLVPVEKDTDRLVTPEDRDAFAKFKISKDPMIVLVSSLDAMFAHRREVTLLTDPAHRKHALFGDGGEKTGFVIDLPSHGILDRGQLVGLWEFDPDAGKIVWASFGPRTKAIAAAVEVTETYLRDQVGDARSFSLDSPKSRAPRLEALRKTARG